MTCAQYFEAKKPSRPSITRGLRWGIGRGKKDTFRNFSEKARITRGTWTRLNRLNKRREHIWQKHIKQSLSLWIGGLSGDNERVQLFWGSKENFDLLSPHISPSPEPLPWKTHFRRRVFMWCFRETIKLFNRCAAFLFALSFLFWKIKNCLYSPRRGLPSDRNPVRTTKRFGFLTTVSPSFPHSKLTSFLPCPWSCD